jgi:hypothetical protein
MPGTPYPLGPFTAGMNNISEEATVDDNQVTLAKNLELDFDGSYRSRPAIVADAATPVGGQQLTALGYYVRDDGTTFLVCTTNAKTWLYDIETKAFTEIWANKASGFCQRENKVVLISESVAGGYWEGGTFTATASMPVGSQIVVYQDRLWAVGVPGTSLQNRVYFSNITTAGTSPTSIWDWTTATDWIEVSKGDGERITALVADANALLIFRTRSFWRFTYPNSPFKGTLREQVATLGADSRYAVVPYESYYLVFNQGVFYQLINFQYYPLNNKRIEFRGAALGGGLVADREVVLSIFGARCLVWYYGTIYSYDIITNTWSMWESPTTSAAQFLQIPQTSLDGSARQALALSGEQGKLGLYRVIDDELPAGAAGESMTCVLRTKSYDFDEAAQFKRLYYWTFEVRTSSGAVGVAYPSAIPTDAVTYDDLDATDYDTLDLGSWDNPLILVPSYVTDAPFPAAAPVRALVKAIQAARFLRMHFEITLECDGTARTSPSRIYSITPYVRIKASVAKQVS